MASTHTANLVQVPARIPRIAVYLQPEIKEQLERLAMLERRSLSQLAAIIIEEAVKKAEEEGKIPARE